MIKKNQFKNIIISSKFFNYLDPDLPDEFPGGGGDGDSGGGTGGSGNGTTSINTVPSLSISPNINQSIATGTTICFNASGNIGFPQEAEKIASLDGGCSNSINGTWIKNCGTNGQPDAEAYDTKLIYKHRPFQFTGTNSSFNNPGPPNVNSHLFLGVKTLSGYYFFGKYLDIADQLLLDVLLNG